MYPVERKYANRYVYRLNIPGYILDHEAMRIIRDQACTLGHLSVPFICFGFTRASSFLTRINDIVSFHKELVRIFIAVLISGTTYLTLLLIDGQSNRQHSSRSCNREQILAAASNQRRMQTRAGGPQDPRGH